MKSSLKCLAAKAIRKHNVSSNKKVSCLISFIQLHRREENDNSDYTDLEVCHMIIIISSRENETENRNMRKSLKEDRDKLTKRSKSGEDI